MCHSLFGPIGGRCGLGKPTACLISRHGESNFSGSVPEYVFLLRPVAWTIIFHCLNHAGESLRFLASDWLRNGSWMRGSVPGGSATVSLPLAI